MRQPGWAWIEDWKGYQEVHFPKKTVSELRISFDGRWVQVDELEILEAEPDGRNVATESFGTVVRDNPVTHSKEPIHGQVDQRCLRHKRLARHLAKEK